MAEKTYTQDDVRKAWSEKVGREDQYDLVEVESFDGDSQTQLIDKDTGSISVAVDGTGAKALKKLAENAGDTFIDGAVTPKEASSVKSERRFTSRGVIATPSQPENLQDATDPVEVDNRKPAEARQSEPKAPVTRTDSTSTKSLGKGTKGAAAAGGTGEVTGGKAPAGGAAKSTTVAKENPNAPSADGTKVNHADVDKGTPRVSGAK